MTTFDPNKLKFVPERKRPSIFREYLEKVANKPALLAYKEISQYGGKRGESLYTHLLNGIMLLEALKRPLHLTDLETQLLFTIFTIHDINKDPDYDGKAYGKIAVLANFAQQIQKFHLDTFFPNYPDYLDDITRIAGQHSGHSGPMSVVAASSSRLTDERMGKLLDLIRAVDIVDLSHTLTERKHKATFLSYLNDFVDDCQYTFYIHRLVENRGTLSNIIHHAVAETLNEAGLMPLLYYPDGIAYLLERGQQVDASGDLLAKIGKKTAIHINDLTSQEFESFVVSAIAGIKVDPKCLALGIPFETLLNSMHTRVQKRNLNRDDLLVKVVNRTERTFEKNKIAYPEEEYPETAVTVRHKLDNPETILPASSDRLRTGELIRTYYIFLNTHFKETIPDAWEYVYDLFAVPVETRQWLAFFDSRWDRPYALMTEIALSHEEIYEKIEVAGTAVYTTVNVEDDKVDLFRNYLGRYALFGIMGTASPLENGQFEAHLQQYTANQHKQCVHCSAILPTDKWMTNDVRSDITVQTFSNRLRGGPGEPKKYICHLCQLQFLVERLNYEEVRGEKTMYLHLFPYSFLPAPYLSAMQESIDQIRYHDNAVRALWCDTRAALLDKEKGVDPDFATQTKEGKPHPYGIYMPRKSRNTIGNRLIFPINPAGDNDSQRFLFALWIALVMQKHLGLRVMLTESPVSPFIPEVELTVDNVALSCRGLLIQNDYGRYLADHKTDGALVELQKQAVALHTIAGWVRTTGKLDELLALVQAMANGSLSVYYTAEKLLEARVRNDKKASSPEWSAIRLSQQLFNDVKFLADSTKGGHDMTDLSQHLQELAEIAWKGGLKGKSLKKNSLMMPLDHVFQKLNQRSQAFDDDALKAVAAEDIFEYLERIADEYKPGKRKIAAATEFVEYFFTNVYQGIYQGNRARLLTDEKLLRSAYMFYIRKQIKSKKTTEDNS